MESQAIIDVETGAGILRRGGLVGMPTETVYGLAGNALDPSAVASIFATKQRPAFDPLIIHVAKPEDAWEVAEADSSVIKLAEAFWPGPLTMVLPRRSVVPDLVTSGLETVGVRCPDHPVARALITAAALPLAAPSANLFGRLSPTRAADVIEQFAGAVPVVDGGPCRVGVESTVLLLGDEPTILRPGGVTPYMLREVLGHEVRVGGREEREESLGLQAPGMLASHYAPGKPTRLLEQGEQPKADEGLLTFSQENHSGPVQRLSAQNLPVAAAGLFAALRALDAAPCDGIAVRLAPNKDLGLAINDRLTRAAGRG